MSFESRAKKAGIALTVSLRAAMYDGIAYAVMVGAGESYLSAYAIFLNATPLQLGILTSLPPFIGAFGQLLGLFWLQMIDSRRRLFVRSAFVNAAIWAPLALLPIFGRDPGSVWFMLLFLVVYYASAGVGGPPWNSLIGDLVPEDIRGVYFGVRNRYIGLYTFVTMVVAGQLLEVTKRFDITGFGYFMLCMVACGSRFISRHWLAQYDDVPHVHSAHHYFTFWQFIRRLPKSNFARFVFYISIINGAVAFSGPFFTLYMLRDLQFSYTEFTLAAAASVMVQFLTMQFWGALVDKFGSKKLLNILGFGIVIAPMLWLFNDSLLYIILIQFYNGAVWAGFNLSAATFLFDAVTPAKRARCTAYQGAVNGCCVLAGAVLGGLTVDALPNAIHIGKFIWTPESPLYFLFVISGLLRLTASLYFLPRFKEVTEVEPIRHRELLFRLTGIRPISGITFSIFTGVSRKRRQPEESRAPEKV